MDAATGVRSGASPNVRNSVGSPASRLTGSTRSGGSTLMVSAISVGSGIGASGTGSDTTSVCGSRKTGSGASGLVGGSSMVRDGGAAATTVAASGSSTPRRGGSQNVP
jgi:hypothetical protein